MEVGSQWNRWTVESLIGEGRFGKVYKLVRTEFGHTYDSALKVIRIPQNDSEYRSIQSEGLDEESISSYYRSVVEEIVSECSLMYELKGNSNIVSYEGHQVMELEDSFGWEIFIQMELLTPLVKYMSEHSMSEQDTIRLGIDICKALEICQSYNIIHRDIKPENIFISKQGNFKLGDFGIARRMEGATAGMSKKGTVAYMAPEVFTGKPYNATVDTYSLGIVMYRLVNNNRTPFLPPYPEKIKFSDKETADWLRMSGEELPAPAGASDRLSAVILKACSYDPKERYDSPRALREALESIESDNEESAVVYPEGDAIDPEMSETATELTEPPTETDLPADEHVEEEPEPETVMPEPEPEAEPEKSAPVPAPQENSGKKRKALLIALAAAILLMCCGIGAYKYYHHPVPNVVGKDEETAINYMENAGLKTDITREFSDDAAKGMVLSQSVDEGAEVKSGTVIELAVSRGKAVTAPDLTGKSVEDATAEAVALNLLLNVSDKEYSDTVSKGCVISQKPDAGEKVEEGTKILVVKSRGVEKVKVPDVTGISSDEAAEKLKSAKLNAEIVQTYSYDVESGITTGQSVDAGEKIEKNSTVTVYVSIGPAPKKSTPSKKKKSSGNSGGSGWEQSF